jgi:hypothetical protein
VRIIAPRKGETTMSTPKSESKAAALAEVHALVAGIQANFPNGSFTIGNTAFTTASLVQALEAKAEAIQSLNAAQAAARDAVAKLRSVEAEVDPIIADVHRFLAAVFGASVTKLAEFGREPRKVPAPRTVEQKAAARAKLRATREARGTKSRKAKLAIKGDVTGVVITPVVGAQPAPATPTK